MPVSATTATRQRTTPDKARSGQGLGRFGAALGARLWLVVHRHGAKRTEASALGAGIVVERHVESIAEGKLFTCLKPGSAGTGGDALLFEKRARRSNNAGGKICP